MKKIKVEKGITLIALIITIVVLLILAVVAINAVTGDGIIQHAVNAKTSYKNAQDNENSTIQGYMSFLENEVLEIEGQVKMIRFVLGGVEYEAEEGMNWYEWCSSKYNTSNKWVCQSLNGQITDGGTSETGFNYVCHIWLDSNGGFGSVTGNDLINAGEGYTFAIVMPEESIE